MPAAPARVTSLNQDLRFMGFLRSCQGVCSSVNVE
jgi:hypothetical protein